MVRFFCMELRHLIYPGGRICQADQFGFLFGRIGVVLWAAGNSAPMSLSPYICGALHFPNGDIRPSQLIQRSFSDLCRIRSGNVRPVNVANCPTDDGSRSHGRNKPNTEAAVKRVRKRRRSILRSSSKESTSRATEPQADFLDTWPSSFIAERNL